jgi:hypothetical protein
VPLVARGSFFERQIFSNFPITFFGVMPDLRHVSHRSASVATCRHSEKRRSQGTLRSHLSGGTLRPTEFVSLQILQHVMLRPLRKSFAWLVSPFLHRWPTVSFIVTTGSFYEHGSGPFSEELLTSSLCLVSSTTLDRTKTRLSISLQT